MAITDKPGSPAEAVAELQHYGVLGMHWGVRKARPVGNRVKRASGAPRRTAGSMSQHEQARERGFKRIMLGLAVGGTVAYGALRLSKGGVNRDTLKLAGLGARIAARGIRVRAAHGIARGAIATQRGIDQARLVGRGARSAFMIGYRNRRQGGSIMPGRSNAEALRILNATRISA